MLELARQDPAAPTPAAPHVLPAGRIASSSTFPSPA